MSEASLRWRFHRPSARRGFTLLLAAAAAVSAGVLAVSSSSAASSVPSATLVWSLLSPSSSPPPLAYASAVYDSDNHTIVLFGGLNSQGSPSNSTWVWNGTSWTDYSAMQIEEPPARYLASMGFDPALHQLILFGGRNAAGRQLADTWAWNGASWYNINPRGGNPNPSPRDGATLTYDGQGHLLLFGGQGPVPTPAPVPQQQPGVGHSSTEPPAVVLGDTWEWGPGGWTQMVTSSAPPARTEASSAFDPASATVLLFGGSSSPTTASSPVNPLGDTWVWDGSAWAQRPSPTPPPPRSSPLLADDPAAGGMVLFAGNSGSGPLGDTWLWNGTGWTPLSAGTPDPRLGAAGAFESATGQVVVFGGDGAKRVLGDTLVLAAGVPLPLGSPATSPPSTASPPGQTQASPSRGSGRPSSTSSGLGAPQRSRALANGSNGSPGNGRDIPKVRRGQLVTLHGSGFSPGASVILTFHSTPVTVGRTPADQRGDFTAVVPIPAEASRGTHHFEASGLTPSGPATVVLAAIDVVVPGPTLRPSITTTGALLGIALLLPLGAWLLLATRGRLSRHTG